MKGSGDITALRLVHAGGNLNNGANTKKLTKKYFKNEGKFNYAA